jgi:hypothetical protein
MSQTEDASTIAPVPRPFRGTHSRWLTVALSGVREWPDFHYVQNYDGFRFTLLPETDKSPPAIAIELGFGVDDRTARVAIRRFLSAYAWAYGQPAIEDFALGAGFPGGVGKPLGAQGGIKFVVQNFWLEYLPTTNEPRTRLCLALYREALGLNNDAYRFLAFSKVINALFNAPADQIAWINRSIPKLSDQRALERIAQLKATQSDLGSYLYGSGRCAVAHAYAEPLADPDDPEDTERLMKDLPIMRELAEHLVEFELGVKSSDAIRNEHLYELEGFREHFGSALVARLKAKEPVMPSELPALPPLSFHFREYLPLETFLGMKPLITSVENGVVIVECISKSGYTGLFLELDFPGERLRIDPLEGILGTDDGSSQAMLATIHAVRFKGHVFGNRIVEVWTAGGDEPIGRTAPYIPMNMRWDYAAWRSDLKDCFWEYLKRIGSEAIASVAAAPRA